MSFYKDAHEHYCIVSTTIDTCLLIQIAVSGASDDNMFPSMTETGNETPFLASYILYRHFLSHPRTLYS